MIGAAAKLQTVCLLDCQVRSRRLLLGLEVVEQDAALLGLLTPVLDDDARAVDDLAGVALAVNLACKGKEKSAIRRSKRGL